MDTYAYSSLSCYPGTCSINQPEFPFHLNISNTIVSFSSASKYIRYSNPKKNVFNNVQSFQAIFSIFNPLLLNFPEHYLSLMPKNPLFLIFKIFLFYHCINNTKFKKPNSSTWHQKNVQFLTPPSPPEKFTIQSQPLGILKMFLLLFNSYCYIITATSFSNIRQYRIPSKIQTREIQVSYIIVPFSQKHIIPLLSSPNVSLKFMVKSIFRICNIVFIKVVQC